MIPENNPSEETMDWEDEPTAIKPMSMYFPPTEYTKKIKISTRCFITEFMETMDELNPPVTRVEKSWFDNHPQFKHIFHMPKDGNHKVMGMWMLLLRTANIEKVNEAWFAVNGSPIRYSIREHALILGLDCRNYPSNYKEAGSMTFVRKYFGNGIIRHQDVKAKLQEMEASCDRLKMMVLYFLSSIINGQRKTGKDAPSVEPFLLRAVGDLNLCKTFPWGRLSFEHMLEEISHTMEHFGGVVKEGVIWPIPGFCIPMELLAFEAITDLGAKFRESVECVDPACPRMRKSKFKRSEMKGFPISKINKELGKTEDIQNILKASEAEETLLARITEPDEIDDIHDFVVESWMKMIDKGNVVRLSKIEEKVDEYHVRVTVLEDYVQEQVNSMANEMTNHIEKEGGVEKEVAGGGDGNREKVRLKRTKKAANRKKPSKKQR
ncbi:hypothetical protein N665_0178s0015 [Sinapis alba]|nr:hypothetical protein N665_0178s0015 [Sinapis alba]